MAAATKDVGRTYEAGVDPIFNDHALASDATIYEGTVVGLHLTSNEATDTLVLTDAFAGFAGTKAVEGTQTYVKVRAQGIIKVAVTTGGATEPDIGDTVYASDDNTFTMTEGSNMVIGKVHRVVSHDSGTSSTVTVHFQALSRRSI